ncbi:MAG: nucleoside-diphosphate sugar epimerase/dehydratase, partial [Desulfatiglandaceae bacterium]
LIYGWDFAPVLFESLPFTLVPLFGLRFLAFYYYGLFQGYWRYVSFEDLVVIIRAVVISTMAFVALGMIWERTAISERQCALDAILCIFLVGGVRFVVRNFRETFIQDRPPGTVERIVLAGPLKHVQLLVKEILGNPETHYAPVAIVDPERREWYEATRVNDIPVHPIQHIPFRSKRMRNISSVIICWPEATRDQTSDVVEKLEVLQSPFRIIPRVEDILSGKAKMDDIREVDIEDLLERPQVQIDMDQIQALIRDKVVLVTGGGGSIGAELCRQIAGSKPEELVIVERSENSLYELELELRKQFPHLKLHASISSINDGPGLMRLMRLRSVEVVFHAAAYKHVPLMEAAPLESAYNNILGTYNVARAAMEARARRFVMISTDKAVNPTNIMGVCKRIAEKIVQSFNGSTATVFMTVRFGNVLGSAGSVIPVFRNQIKQGGPLTVTHPEIERFFMTIPEAVQLVLQAGAMGNGGEIFVLDMGKPVKILHLAEKLITLSGKRPHQDVEIAFTGLRPGEKMYEELFDLDEKQVSTHHNQIRIAMSHPLSMKAMKSQIEKIRKMVLRQDDHALMQVFKELVPDYQNETAQIKKEAGQGDLMVQPLAAVNQV